MDADEANAAYLRRCPGKNESGHCVWYSHMTDTDGGVVSGTGTLPS